MNNQAIVSIGFWALIIGAFYFILIRPQRKRESKLKNMRDSLKKGDLVITIGGILGTIAKIDEETIVLETGANRTKIVVEKWAIGKVKESSESKTEKVSNKVEVENTKNVKLEKEDELSESK